MPGDLPSEHSAEGFHDEAISPTGFPNGLASASELSAEGSQNRTISPAASGNDKTDEQMTDIDDKISKASSYEFDEKDDYKQQNYAATDSDKDIYSDSDDNLFIVFVFPPIMYQS